MTTENEDYYEDENGDTVFTTQFHLKRGYCCKNKCRHCPWNYGREQQNEACDDKLL